MRVGLQAGRSPASRLLVLLAATVMVSCATVPQQRESLYAELGGSEGVADIVDALLVAIAGDDRIRHHFEGLHIAGFRDRLTTHFCQITGGPCTFDGRSMRQSHRLLGISQADFNALVEDLIAAMDKLGIDHGTQNRFLATLAPMQPDIVTHTADE